MTLHRYIPLLLTALLMVGLISIVITEGRTLQANSAQLDSAPFSETPEPMPTEPPVLPPVLLPEMILVPWIGYQLPPICVGIEVPDIALSPLRPTSVDVRVITEHTEQVRIGDAIADVDAGGIATVTLEASPNQEYQVVADGVLAPHCAFSFGEMESWWVGQHGDPYAWVGDQHWVEIDGLLQLFTRPEVDVVLSPDRLTESEEGRARWTYFVQYASPNMTLYSAMLRPGSDVFQHVYRVVLRTSDNRVLRIKNIGHVTRPEHLDSLTVDTGPDTPEFEWVEGEQFETNGFTLEFVRSRTHNGIHQAVLVTVPDDDSEWVFTREINGHGAFISGRIDGRLFADNIDQIEGVFGHLLRGEPPNANELVVGVVDGDLPGELQTAASPVEITILDQEQWDTIVGLFSDDW